MSVSNQPKFVSDDIFRARSTRCFCTMPSTCTSRCWRKSLSRDWTGTTAVSGTTSLATGPRTVSAFVIVLDTCGFHGALRNRSSKREGNSLCRNFVLSWTGGSVAEWLACRGPGFKSHQRRCRVTVLGKLFTPIVPLFAKQQNW